MSERAAGPGTSGAAEPAVCNYLMLEPMNKGSAGVGTFLVRVSHPKASSYSFKRRSGQGMGTQHKYSRLLLGAPEGEGATDRASGEAQGGAAEEEEIDVDASSKSSHIERMQRGIRHRCGISSRATGLESLAPGCLTQMNCGLLLD